MPISGIRGTEQLSPEQRPRSRKMRGRTQPYRRRKPRLPGPTLDAMLAGRTASGHNPQDYKRAFQRAYRRGR